MEFSRNMECNQKSSPNTPLSLVFLVCFTFTLCTEVSLDCSIWLGPHSCLLFSSPLGGDWPGSSFFCFLPLARRRSSMWDGTAASMRVLFALFFLPGPASSSSFALPLCFSFSLSVFLFLCLVHVQSNNSLPEWNALTPRVFFVHHALKSAVIPRN